MFTHILLPTDGSRLSEAAIQRGIEFAKDINAKVTGFYAAPPFHVFTSNTEMLEDTEEQFANHSRMHAEEFLSVVQRAAKSAGVPFDTAYVTHDHPYEAIIEAAEKNGCDLIMMASHERHGLKAVLGGSETQKVFTHSKIPVLVYR